MTHHLVGTAEIAAMLGVSRQRVDQIVDSYEDFPAPEAELSAGRVWSRTAVETWIHAHPDRGPGRREADRVPTHGSGAGLFERFTDRARQSVVKAQEEARMLRHNYIGTEHLLLGLLGVGPLGASVAATALQALGVDTAWVRDEVRARIGEGKTAPVGHIPFTPRARNVIEFAMKEALELGHNYIGTEHVLLALAAEPDGVAWKMLEDRGLTAQSLREAVTIALEAHTAPVSREGAGSESAPEVERAPAGSDLRCSFCGKPQDEVHVLVAGPGVQICSECVMLGVRVVASQATSGPPGQAELLDRIDRLERRLSELEGD